jgi:hypothetical protein
VCIENVLREILTRYLAGLPSQGPAPSPQLQVTNNCKYEILFVRRVVEITQARRTIASSIVVYALQHADWVQFSWRIVNFREF